MDNSSSAKHDEDCSEIACSRSSIRDYENKELKAAVPQIVAAVSAASFHVAAALGLAFSAIIIPQLFEEQTIGNSRPLGIEIDKEKASWIASVMNIVTIPSALFGGLLIDTIGRLNSIRLAVLPTLLGWILIATSTNLTTLIVGRILTGMPLPWGTGSGAAYITEISSPHLRGSLVSLNSFFISFGYLLIYVMGSLLYWRTVAWISIGVSIVPLVLLIFIPESPSWLMMKGRNEQALKSLEWFNKYQNKSLTKLQYSVEQKRTLLSKQTTSNSTGNGLVEKIKLFLRPTCYKPLLILFAIFFFQQFSGIHMTLVYAVTFMQGIGANINPYVASIYLGIGRFATAIANVWLFRYFKRRHMLFMGTIGMSVSMTISAMFTNWIHEGKTTYTWVPIAMSVLYVIFSMTGLLSLPFIYGSELFPLEVRGIAQSVSLSFSYIVIFIATKCYFVLEDFFGGVAGLQYYFAAMSLGAFIFSYVFVPETHNKKLSDIEEYFRNHATYLSRRNKNLPVGSTKEDSVHTKENTSNAV